MKSSEVGINVGVVLDGLGNLVLVSTGIIKVGAVCPSAKREVSDSDLISHDVLVRGIGLDSLVEDLEPVGESSTIESLQSLSLSLLSGCIGSLVVSLSDILLAVKSRVDSPCEFGISDGVVSVLNTEVAESGSALSVEFA